MTRGVCEIMNSAVARYRLELLGAFRLHAPDGRRLEIASKKGMALVAMLAMAGHGERTRGWLQDRLWGSRQRAQAQQSLRRELGNLRQVLGTRDQNLVVADHDRVRLDLDLCSVDALEILGGTVSKAEAKRRGEFLEGFDIAGEEAFEDWLREQRQTISEAVDRTQNRSAALAVPAPRSTSDGKPGLALIPTNPAYGSEASALLASLERELVDRVARLRWLSVIAPSTIASLQGGHGDAAAIGAAVGARYQLELNSDHGMPGEISATLVDSSSWRTLLATRLPLGAGPDAQALACRNFVAAIDARLETAEQERVLHKPTGSLEHHERIWRARWHLDRLTRRDADLAEELIAAVAADLPDAPETLIQAGFCRAWRVWAGRGSADEMLHLRRTALRAVAADRFDARGHLLLGMAETWLRQPWRARLALEQAIELNPSLCQAYMQLGSALYLGGDPQAALPPMDTALALNPQDTQIFCVMAERGMVRLMLGDMEDAIESAELALLRRPAYWFAHLVKICALVQQGRLADARAARVELQRAKPSFSTDHVEWLPFTHSKWPDLLRRGLQAAGGH